MSEYKVWIDQDLCTGDGICTEITPDVFAMHTDGLAYVKAAGQGILSASGQILNAGSAGTVSIPSDKLDSVIESAEECPGECIFIEQA
jgi:ferredoxin